MTPLIRPPLYALASLVGVQLANHLRPVGIDKAGLAGAGLGAAETAARDALHGNFSAAWDALTGGAKAVGAVAQADVNAQVRNNIIIGVAGGCLVAGIVDLIFL